MIIPKDSNRVSMRKWPTLREDDYVFDSKHQDLSIRIKKERSKIRLPKTDANWLEKDAISEYQT